MLNLTGAKKLILFLVLATLAGCTSRKNLLYFQGNGPAGSESVGTYTPVLKKGDVLQIHVMGLDPETAVPFNLPTTTYYPSNIGGYSQGAPTPPGYLVDVEGFIDFPVIGKLQVAGLPRKEAVEMLKEKLREYIQKPSVIIRILNYKVTVLGEVKNPGTFTIPNERITLPEALGIAGDLLITAVRKNVLVIRDVNGIKSEMRIDLTSKGLFNSPAYFLQQNDIVYVEPNRAKINSSVVNTANAGIAISVLSLIITMATLLTR